MYDNLKDIVVEVCDGTIDAKVSYDRVERQFDDHNRFLLLYSNVHYRSDSFVWDATLPTVKIPYKDPTLGFLIDDVIFSSVGIYGRAPGVVPDLNKRTVNSRTVYEPRIDIVNARNATIYVDIRRNAVQITFKKNDKKSHVPIGVFLKAISSLPYSVILKNIAYKPQIVLNSFPAEIPKGNEDLSKVPVFPTDSDQEPGVDECIDMVYSAITQVAEDSKKRYALQWKHNRIVAYLEALRWKSTQKYEMTLSLGHRAIGTYLDQELDFPYFKREVVVQKRLQPDGSYAEKQKITETVEHFRLPKGHYITTDDAKQIRRFDISTLRVRSDKAYILQEHSPMLFRARGYKLLEDMPDLGATAGTVIDDELLKKINATDLKYLEVATPSGRKVLHRSTESVEVGDFYTILNYLLTTVFAGKTDIAQYEIRNRVILDYDAQVRLEVEQVYNDIIASISGSTELKNLLNALPQLPSNHLASYLRDAKNKEVSQSDITNIMSRYISDTTASALVKETPMAMMNIQEGQYGRIDSFHAPDSDKVGSVQHLTVTSRINADGEIEAPYERIENGTPTGRIEYITAGKEYNKYIVAWDCDLTQSDVLARCNGDVTTVSRDRVNYRDPSPYCDMSVSRACNPLPEFSQPKRALMAAKMNGQAIPILKPERPLVSTGADTIIPGLYYTGHDLLRMNEIREDPNVKTIELISFVWGRVSVSYKMMYNGNTFEVSLPFTATDKESLFNYNVNYKGSKVFDIDDIIFYNQSCDLHDYDYWVRMKQGALPIVTDYKKPALALGLNLRVCFKTFGSLTIEDALVISSRLVEDNSISSIQIIKYNYKLSADESYGPGWSAECYSYVSPGSPVITFRRTKGLEGYISKSVEAEQFGQVVFVDKDDKTGEAEVWVATVHHAEVGDKMAGRYGNKSVIAKILPEYEMPYDPDDGVAMDVIASPLGLPSRMNFGLILEAALGAVMSKESRVAIISPFYPNIKSDIIKEYTKAGFAPKRLFNPAYGKLTERPVFTGVLYYFKLEQMSNLKYAAVGYPKAVDTVFGQPVRSINQDKGQSMEEMITWALIASGAKKTLNSLFTMYSDDEAARRSYFDMLAQNYCDYDENGLREIWEESEDGILEHSLSKNALVTQTIMRMFGLDIDAERGNNRYHIVPLNLDDIPIMVSRTEFLNGREPVKDFEWFRVPLAAPVINPFWVCNFPLHIVLGIKSVRALADGKSWLDPDNIEDRENCVISSSDVDPDQTIRMLTGVTAIIELIKHTTIESAIARIQSIYGTKNADNVNANSDDETVYGTVVVDPENGEESEGNDDYTWIGNPGMPMNVGDVLRFLIQMKKSGMKLTDLIWHSIPIMPRVFRQDNVLGTMTQQHSFQVQLKAICSARATTQEIYQSLKTFIGYGTPKQSDLVTIRGFFFGKGAQAGQHGKVRSAVLSKRVGFSGRTVIVPMEDPTISPFFVCLPWRVLVVELARPLAIRVYNRLNQIIDDLQKQFKIHPKVLASLSIEDCEKLVLSLAEFNEYKLSKVINCETSEMVAIYHHLRTVVKRLIEGEVSPDGMIKINGEWKDPQKLAPHETIDCAVVASGRQPTLHKQSIRGFFVKVIDGYCMRIHPIICPGFNADFDGDQMWHLQMLGDNKADCLQKISVLEDLISEKDGSYTLGLQQDIILGLYCATTFKDNAKWEGVHGGFLYFDDLKELRTRIEQGYVHYYDAVVFYNESNKKYYCSTAGRILVNGCIPGTFTLKPFTDPNGICKVVLGENYISSFCELLYDTVFTATGDRPEDRPNAVKVNNILVDVYNTWGPRKSVMTAQALYEVGLVASDIYSVSITLDDMSSSVDKQAYMEEPKKTVSKLNTLYDYGLITAESRKLSSARAWDDAKVRAKKEIIRTLDPKSNIYYMMYSGARGKPDQLVQSVGFIGNISKTTTTDIEYPILHGYGEGLTSLDLFQTCYSARIGVISTQAGTKDTGYATRQSVYMMSGFNIKEDDCGINWTTVQVEYTQDSLHVKEPDGTLKHISSLLGEFVSETTEHFEELKTVLNLSGYIINDRVLEAITKLQLSRIDLLNRSVEIVASIDPEWRRQAIEEAYSYALPFTDGMKVTEATVDFIEKHGMKEVVAFGEGLLENDECFDQEAYMPVLYNTSSFTLIRDGREVSTEDLLVKSVADDSPGIKYFKNLLTSTNLLTESAIAYLTQKKVPSIKFTDGDIVTIKYKLSELFKNIVEGRESVGLLYLDMDGAITEDTLSYIEDYQLQYIPVRTGLTCLSEGGICSKCYGKSPSSKQFLPKDYNLGIAAAQAMCEPLSQSSLNVGHSGGKRDAGIGLVSGLSYYTKLLQGSMISERTKSTIEKVSPISGYLQKNIHNPNFIQVVSDCDEVVQTLTVDNPDRVCVPDGGYVDANDVVISGLPDLERYKSHDVFQSALKTRLLLMEEYYKIFRSLDVSARNTEILARAQTSSCYFDNTVTNVPVNRTDLSKVRDTAIESVDPTGCYTLMVSSQARVVNQFTGIAAYGFENVTNILLMNLFTPEGIALNSALGNLITGTEVGSTEVKFLPRREYKQGTKYKKSAVREFQEALDSSDGDSVVSLSLGVGDSAQDKGLYSTDLESDLISALLIAEEKGNIIDTVTPAELTDGQSALDLLEPKVEVDVSSELSIPDAIQVAEEQAPDEFVFTISDVSEDDVESEDIEHKSSEGSGIGQMNLT